MKKFAAMLALVCLSGAAYGQVEGPPMLPYDPVGHPTATDPGPPDARTIETTEILADLLGGKGDAADLDRAASRLHVPLRRTSGRNWGDVEMEVRGDVSVRHDPTDPRTGQETLSGWREPAIGSDPQKPEAASHCIFADRMRDALAARGWRRTGDASFLLVWSQTYGRGRGDGEIGMNLDARGCVRGIARHWWHGA